MTDDKILEVVRLYEQRLHQTISFKPRPAEALGHLLEMIPEMRKFVADGRRDKVFRWLGFMQGVLYSFGLYTIEEMADHNRPVDEA